MPRRDGRPFFLNWRARLPKASLISLPTPALCEEEGIIALAPYARMKFK